MKNSTGILLLLALGVGAYFLLSATAVISQPWANLPNYLTWAATLSAAEAANGLPAGLLASVAYQESGFQTAVIEGTEASSAGALGMMQLLPQYFSSVQGAVPFSAADISAQINQAAQQLASLYAQFKSWPNALAAYNAGASSVSSALAGNGTLPASVASYVAAITGNLPQGMGTTGMTGATGATGGTGSTA